MTENSGVPCPETAKKPAWAKSQVALAEVLGVDRKTIKEWLKIPGNPGKNKDDRYDVEAWREWQAANSYNTTQDQETLVGDESVTIVGLRAQKLQEEILRLKQDSERLKLANEVERGELITLDEAKQVIGNAYSAMIAALRQMKHRISSQVCGLDSGSITRRLWFGEMKEPSRSWSSPSAMTPPSPKTGPIRIANFSRVIPRIRGSSHGGAPSRQASFFVRWFSSGLPGTE